MRVAIYDPYLDTLGGGERYILTIAEILSQKERVDLLIGTHLKGLEIEKYKKTVAERLNINLEGVNFIDAPIGKGSNILKRLFFLRKYDLLVSFTDGSIFYTSAKRNILHIQSPIINKRMLSRWNRKKLSSWDLVIYNSKFTQRESLRYWPIDSVVVYPPVMDMNRKVTKKKQVILSVGRFFNYLREKKHEVMIEAFKQLYDRGVIKEWKLCLAGSAKEGDKEYVEELRSLIKGYPIEILENISYESLKRLYSEASIYWHAMGYKESDPTKMEHFGITTVEAMTAGCVPVVINKGGQLEIVEEGKTGFLWRDIDELVQKTLRLTRDKKLMIRLSNAAAQKSDKYNFDHFKKRILEIVYG